MTCAYDELYLAGAQRILGDMYDYAVNTLGIVLGEFQRMFLVSGVAEQFGAGNPMYIAGMNGCEIAKEVVESCTGVRPEVEDAMYIDRSPEYWLGWSLAYYQWQKGIGFKAIERVCPIESMYGMYATLHEADISVFVEIIDEKCDEQMRESALRRLRKYAELTQNELAREAGVPLRQVQLFEQGVRDIRKCQGQTLAQLAKVLNCRVEDLLISSRKIFCE